MTGSLCSGYEGFGLALNERPAWVADIDPDAAKLLANRFPDVPNLGDITTVDWSQVEPVDVLTAGYPCQPFSHAGKRKGSDDSRHIWPSVARAVGVLRPRVCFLENVAGHVSLGLADVLADLAALGYDATWGVVRAADAGAPHGRARVFVVAADADRTRGRFGQRPGQAASAGGCGEGEARADLREDAERGGCAAADPTGDGRDERRAEPARLIGRPDAAQRGPTTPDANDANRRCRDAVRGPIGRTAPASSGEGSVQWGAYEPAIRRWEAVINRPAPRPTEPGRTGERLSPRFVEWMQGLPEGWVCDVPELSRNAQLRLLGNGIVPQQAALAWRVLNNLRAAAA